MTTKLSKYWLAIDKSKQTTIITLTVLHFLLLPLRTSVVAASFQLCAMRDTNSTLLGLLVTSLEAATLPLFNFCAMRDADSSSLGLIVTPVEAASFSLSTMSDTNSSIHDLIVTSHVATSFPRCAMSHTDSSLHGSIDTSLLAAFLSSPYARLDTWLGFSDDRLFLRPLHLWDN